MKRTLITLAGGLLIGATAAAYAELPPPTPEEKAAADAAAEKAKIEKAKAAKEVAQAQDKAVANYRKNKGSSAAAGTTAQPDEQQSSRAAGASAPTQGADHSRAGAPDGELTREEAQTQMPKAGQANDYSTPKRDPQNSSTSR